MNGNGGRYETDTLESLLGEIASFEAEDYGEADYSEARRGGRRSPPRTASGSGLSTPRPSSQYVTQTQLQTALTKVGAQIKTNSDAITSVSNRVSTQTELLTKEVAARKKESEQIKRDLRQTREMAAILPLLSQPSSVQLTAAAVPTGTTPPKALVDSGDTLSTLLPFLLLGGMGGSSSGSGGGGGGGMFGSGGGDDSSSMMMMVLLLTLGKR